MTHETFGVVQLRPDVSWTDVLRLYNSAADPTSHRFSINYDRFIEFDPDNHEVQYQLDYGSLRDTNFLEDLQEFAREGWASRFTEEEEPTFFGPQPYSAALRYWTQQRDRAQDKINELS